MDGPPAQSLGVETVDEKVLRQKPRKSSDPIVTKALLLRAVSSALLIVFLTLKVFTNELNDGKMTRRDTTMTFMTFVNCDLFNAYACKSSERCFYELNPFDNPAFLWAIGGSIIGQLAVVYFPPLQEVFQTEALSIRDMSFIIILSSSILMLDTLRKTYFSSLFNDVSAGETGIINESGIQDGRDLDLENLKSEYENASLDLEISKSMTDTQLRSRPIMTPPRNHKKN